MRRSDVIVAALAVVLMVAPAPAQKQAKPKADQPLKADPANDLFQLALLAYREAVEQKNAERQKETYLAAVRQFDRFHTTFPKHSNALKSWYYSAVCYQKVGNLKGYRNCLSKVVTTWKEGPLVGAAAYQLAHEHYKARKYDEAEPLYQLSAEQTDNEDFRHKAVYSRALCFEKLEKRPESIAALKAVLADEGSPFREGAERVLAHHYKEDGKKEEALAHFINLISSPDVKTKADATLQCARLARELKKKESAKKYFEAILVTPGLEEWRDEAQLSLMSTASRAEEHQAVIDYFNKGKFPLDKAPMAQRLQLAAKAFEALGQKDRSTALLRELSKIAPNNMTAFEAGYVVISREYKTGGRELTKQADEFIKRFETKHPDDPRIHNARLMLAEGHYQAGNYAAAALVYGKIGLKHIAKENHGGLRYRLSSALLQAGDREAALKAFDLFIEKHPDHPQAINAIVKRAEVYLEGGDSSKAHRELERLLAKAKNPQLKEYAWAQKAGLYKQAIEDEAARQREGDGNPARQSENLAKFAECHERLIADFPDRDPEKRAASEFWRGWALYRQDQFAECLEPFKRARETDAGTLGRESTLHLALANYQLQQRDELKTELDLLLKNYPNENVPRPVFAWLGTSFAREENYPEGWHYLKYAITPKEPTKTKVVVWRAAGRSALEAGAFEESIRPLEIVLQVEENKFRQSETNYLLARAHFKLNDPERARKAAEACLDFKPQGILNAQARLILGDIAMSQGDPHSAAKHYVAVVEFYSKDRTIALKALRRAISALELKGGEKSLKSAKRYRERLQKLQNAAQSTPSG